MRGLQLCLCECWQRSKDPDDGVQAFINTARKIYEKIEQGVFDVSNEVRPSPADSAEQL